MKPKYYLSAPATALRFMYILYPIDYKNITVLMKAKMLCLTTRSVIKIWNFEFMITCTLEVGFQVNLRIMVMHTFTYILEK